MNLYYIKNIFLKTTCVLVACHQFVAGNGLRVMRPTLEEVEWAKERDTITKTYQDNEKGHVILKIEPIFVAVKLNLGEPISEYGAALREFAYVYSEVESKNGEIIKRITVLGRSPYEDRRWSPLDIIDEGKEPVSNVLVIKPLIEVIEQLTNYSKKIIGPLGLRDHVVTIILFDKGASEVLGKVNPEQIRSVFLE